MKAVKTRAERDNYTRCKTLINHRLISTLKYNNTIADLKQNYVYI